MELKSRMYYTYPKWDEVFSFRRMYQHLRCASLVSSWNRCPFYTLFVHSNLQDCNFVTSNFLLLGARNLFLRAPFCANAATEFNAFLRHGYLKFLMPFNAFTQFWNSPQVSYEHWSANDGESLFWDPKFLLPLDRLLKDVYIQCNCGLEVRS